MADKTLVKRANQEIEYTPKQLNELKKCITDPVYFIEKYMRIQHPTKGAIPFKMYPFQKKSIHNFVEHHDNILLMSRQVGKTTCTAGYLLWYTSFQFDKTVMILSNKNASAMEIIHRIKYAYENLPMWLKAGVTADGWNKHSVIFDNGSRIMSGATSEDSGRTFSISLLFLDEFAFVRDSIQETFWTSISPTLAEGGQCIICSTPNGDSNLFANLWRGAVSELNGFHTQNVIWKDVPTRTEEWARQERAKIGDRKFRQEHETEFLSNDPLLIDTVYLAQMEVIEPILEKKEFKFYKEIKEKSAYIISVDPSTGTGLDFSVIEVFSFPELEQVAEFRSNTMSSVFLYKALNSIINFIDSKGNDVYWSVENNGVGEGILALYENDENTNQNATFISQANSKRLGFTTTHKTKLKACVDFKDMLENGTITIRSKILLSEMKNFTRKNNSYEAKSGSTDDCISASLIMTRILTEISEYEEEAFDLLYNQDKGDEWFSDNSNGYQEDSINDAPTPMVF